MNPGAAIRLYGQTAEQPPAAPAHREIVMHTTGPVVTVSSVSLIARARSLRAQATHMNPVLAGAYRRRAAELQMEAWARAARRAPVSPDDYARPAVTVAA